MAPQEREPADPADSPVASPEQGEAQVEANARASAAGETPEPTTDASAVNELMEFGKAFVGVAEAEWALTYAAFWRAWTHGLVSMMAGFIAWSAGLVAVILALVALFDSVMWAFATVAVVHVIVGFVAWKRRMLWQRRIGFPRTRATASVALGLRTPPT